MFSIWLVTPTSEKSSENEVRKVLTRFKPYKSPLELERVGSGHDGGYLIPKDLSGVKALFSPGVGDNIEFDLEIANRGIPVYLADNSVDLDASNLPLVSFRKQHLAVKDSLNEITLGSWMELSGFDSNSNESFMLQMDIEGAEWEIGKNLDSQTLGRFKIILVEVHELQRICTKVGLEEVSSWFDRLSGTHKIVNAHVNNGDLPVPYRGILIPPLVELVFLRDDCFSELEDEIEIPHPLESPNDRSFKQTLLSFWG